MTEQAQFKRYMTPKVGVVLGTLIGLILAYGMGMLLPWRPPPKVKHGVMAGTPPKLMFQAPSYTGFVNQLGRQVASRDFAGKVQVVTFMFPYCGNICPILASRMVNLETMLKERGLADQVQLVSFNVDATGAGPAEMRAFMREFGADPSDPHWQFLTSTPDEIQRVVRDGFHTSYDRIDLKTENKIFEQQRQNRTFNFMPDMHNALADKAKPDYDITHNSSAIIVGPDGRVRYILGQANTVSVKVMFNDILRLLRSDQGA